MNEPVDGLMVTTAGLLLIHDPPVVISVSEPVEPAQILSVPAIAAGIGNTVTARVT